MGIIPYMAMLLLIILFAIDYLMLFTNKQGIFCSRTHAERFSNGDNNPVTITIVNTYVFEIKAEVIDEIPHQFQRRDISFKTAIKPGEKSVITYDLRPVKRGVYNFGTVNLFVSNNIGLLSRRYKFKQPAK